MNSITKRLKIVHVTEHKRKRPDTVQKVILKKIKFNNIKTPLIIKACAFGHLDVVNGLLQQDSSLVNITEHTGRTPLIFAVIVGKDRVVERLLEVQEIDIDMI